MQRRDDITEPADASAFWPGLVGAGYVLIAIYLFYAAPQTGMSPLKNLAVAALLTFLFAADFFVLLSLVRFIIRVIKSRNN